MAILVFTLSSLINTRKKPDIQNNESLLPLLTSSKVRLQRTSNCLLMDKIINILLFLVIMVPFRTFGQADSCWTVLVLKKGNALKIKPNMSSFNTNGFYMYRNCIYEIDTKSGQHYSGRLIDIKPDTLYFTNYFNENAASKAGFNLDTLGLHIDQLDKLNLISDRSMGLYTKHSFDHFDLIFKRDTIHCSLASKWSQIYSNDSSAYELVPHLTAQGINLLFEESGRTYFYYGTGMIQSDRSKMDTTYDVKNVFWFTPCKVENINGLAFGVFSENIKNDHYYEKDSLTINGLNLEVNPFSIMSMLMYPAFIGPYPDSIEFYHEILKKDIETKINGININPINTINESEINGLNITGLITLVDEINGFSFSGISAFSYSLKGIGIAGIYNRATIAKGLQIGLVNKSVNSKGIQIGLWNTNGKRSLPFINWQFKEKT